MGLLVSLDVTMDFLVWRMHTIFAVICAVAFGDVRSLNHLRRVLKLLFEVSV